MFLSISAETACVQQHVFHQDIYSSWVVFVMGGWFIIIIIVLYPPFSFKYFLGQKKKTKVIDNNLDPVWNEVQCCRI